MGEADDDGTADGNGRHEPAETQTPANGETSVKATETNGSKPNRSRSKSQGGPKRRPRPAPRGRNPKPPTPPRERVIVNGIKPLDAPSDENGVADPRRPSIENGTSQKPPIETQNGHRNSHKSQGAASPGTADLQDRVVDLEDRLERLSTVCEAMWQLLAGEVGLSLDQLAAKVEERSNEDKRLDQSPEPPAPQSICPDCGETMPVGSKICLFCSARANGTAFS